MLKQDHEIISLEKLKNIKNELDVLLNANGFECCPFKVGWYNDHVSKPFQLSYPPDTVAFIIISTPSMFEKSFIPFLLEADCVRSRQDPIDQCMLEHFSKIKEIFPAYNIVTIHDFELTNCRRPKILVQTAGHVSGAVRYYQRKDLKSDPWDDARKIFGVCLHPCFGGWFALRGVALFCDVTCPNLQKPPPREILKSDEEIVELLHRYNDHWEDWSFRDVIAVRERYSEEQKEYFSTKPAERTEIINKLKNAVKNGGYAVKA